MPLPCSLDPLPDESLSGFLLRLAHRLEVSPIRLARLTGSIRRRTDSVLGRRLLLDLDISRFAEATRLTEDEATELTLLPWQSRYPPITRALASPDPRATREDWLFNDFPRYCPECLAGDGSPVQQRYGGAWKRIWHLPIAFACPTHKVFLRHGCQQVHELQRTLSHLIAQAADSTLHPGQCRFPIALEGQNAASRKGRRGPSCGARLDQADNTVPVPSSNVLKTQHQLLGLLTPSHTAEGSASHFTDLRVLTAFLCSVWPASRNMIFSSAHEAVAEHVRTISIGASLPLGRPPANSIATAGLLTAASTLLNAPDLDEVLARHTRETWDERPSRTPWTQVFDRHRPSCSQRLQQAAAPSTRSYRRTSPRGNRVPDRTVGYRPENVSAFLEQEWFDKHLAPLEPGPYAKSMRRLGAVLLVQWAAGGAMGDAADYLGINPRGGQFTTTAGLHRWLRNHGSTPFNQALRNLARDLDAVAAPVNYHRRRKTLHRWALTRDTWQEVIARLPPVPGPFQPKLDSRKRQEASAFIWANVTQGEPLFAPRPIEAAQPQDVRATWLSQRASTWAKLACPNPTPHYAALRTLLLQQAELLIREIESGPILQVADTLPRRVTDSSTK